MQQHKRSLGKSKKPKVGKNQFTPTFGHIISLKKDSYLVPLYDTGEAFPIIGSGI